MDLTSIKFSDSVNYRGTPDGLLRALRKCAMAGYSLPGDQDKIQRTLDREAKRAEVARVLQVSKSGGIS